MDDHRHLVRCPGIAPAGASTNLKYVLTPDSSPGSNAVRVWNLSTKVNAPQGYVIGRTDGRMDGGFIFFSKLY